MTFGVSLLCYLLQYNELPTFADRENEKQMVSHVSIPFLIGNLEFEKCEMLKY